MKSDFDDKDLDQLLRSKALSDAEEPEFDEAAWIAMERLLDKRKGRMIYYYLSAATLFLGMLSIGWLFLNINENSSLKEKKYANNVQEIQKNKTIDVPKVTAENNISNTDKKSTEMMKEKLLAEDKSSIADQKRVISFIKKSNKQHQFNLTNLSLNESSNLEGKLTIENGTNYQRERIEKIELTDYKLASQAVKIKAILFNDHKNTATAPSTGSKNVSLNKKPVWSLGFSAGPEINTLGGGSKAGNNLNGGINISGKLNKFSLSLGANYGLKTYNASTTQYQNIKPQFISYIKSIDAACNILEVPIGVSYELATTKKSSFNLNVGFSSYFMLKEKYTYQYKPYSGYSDYTVTRINRNQHYFKVIQLSGTYEFDLKNSQSSLGLEPYMKLPLAGVGEGAVYLKSYGLNLHFNYQLKTK